ncbi:hypothetical protein ACMFMG_006338 [Clarireedia jacksonii]
MNNPRKFQVMKSSTLIIAFASGIVRTAAESNCGQIPCLNFDPVDQLVDVSSATGHQYIAPGATDIRGPCPGLNAAANHGYIPRNGILTLAQTISGLNAAYNFGTDLGALLAVTGIVQAGDVGSLTWSIGGPYSGSILSLLGGKPQGISYSHNKYEGDASFGRFDAYTNGGDAHSLSMTKFQHFYNLASNGLYNLSAARIHHAWNRAQSISTNPYYFSPPFAGAIAAPAAHFFVINLFSNHSADEPNGFLDSSTLKSFFGVSGPDTALVWNKGQERIPPNWYRRPSSNPYSTASAVLDLVANILAYPDAARIGGNTGSVNSFAGVDLGNLTGGVYNSVDDLLKGNNLVCFGIQAMQAEIPGAIQAVVDDVAGVVKWATAQLKPILENLGCPALTGYNAGLFAAFPGNGYKPTGRAQPF